MRGEFAGHFIMALATAAAATDDGKERAELRARADYVVRVLGECQQAIDDGGYLSAFPASFLDRLEAITPVWAPYYTLHVRLGGSQPQTSR